MIAFHGDKKNKQKILAQLRAHAKADEIVKGKYWEDGKGCAVGCTVHSDNHAAYETQFGIPQMLARLKDRIFEGLPNERAKKWPLQFMQAIIPGTDLSRVGWQFLHWLLTDMDINPGIDHPLVRDAVKRCADVLVPLTNGKQIDKSAARSAARSAVQLAELAASVTEQSAEFVAMLAARSAWAAQTMWAAQTTQPVTWSQSIAGSAAQLAG